MISFGIESTAHTFGVGIIRDKDILANEKAVYTTKKGGIIPGKLAVHHFRKCDKVILRALKRADISLKEIDVICFSNGPGIGHALRVGAVAARTLSLRLKKPLVGVNHCIAHLSLADLFFQVQDPILLYVSGANTQVITYETGKYRILGETLDQGVGNMLDSFARHLGLGFPGGPLLEQLAKKSKKYITLPYTVKGMDVNFGGILTCIRKKSKTCPSEDLAYSLQETVFAMLTEVAERAMAQAEKDELILGGGVACNARLQEMCKLMCKQRDAECYIPEQQYLVDNGVMIAWLGLLMFRSGISLMLEESGIHPYQRTDDVMVTWRA